MWYAIVFVASSVAIVALTYLLLAASLRQRDREIIQTTLGEFARAYASGGVDALARSDPSPCRLAPDTGRCSSASSDAARDVCS